MLENVFKQNKKYEQKCSFLVSVSFFIMLQKDLFVIDKK